MATEIKQNIGEISNMMTLAVKGTINGNSEWFSYGVVMAFFWLMGKVSTESLTEQLNPKKPN